MTDGRNGGGNICFFYCETANPAAPFLDDDDDDDDDDMTISAV